ncbi:MAG: hypothetical protein UX45_C0033G0009 [Candidatus Uhrbacteria bacterium GW2011_GWF2_46_218]|uniref:Uncharacterized protein n=1 Tax=Candidatus Uhrbacteria bacterium GW2011_GWF2_46_218 TaxID=1619001 RepID=A0A0G1SC59_9BACT|nr:MAG: hypothetical protein UX45_C0033G0009 [Candidatus Uhrbacteria bacterium GW2011_GWF2_46_218]
MKRDQYLKIRQKFCKLALMDQKKAACELRDLALGLENCKNTQDVVEALKNIFAVSERTIFNDFIS